MRTWAVHCDASDQLPDLLAVLRAVEGMYVEFRGRERAGFRRIQADGLQLYERTRHFRIYEPGVVPGLFQTAEYAEARLRRIAEVRGVPDDIAEAVRLRMARQRVLNTERRFAVVSLGIVRMDAERTMWQSPGFWMFDDGQVTVETPTAELTITQPREVQIYTRVFAELSSMAVVGGPARALIMAAMDRLGV